MDVLTMFGLAVVALIALPVAVVLAVTAAAVAIPAFILASPFWAVAIFTGNMTIGWVATAIAAVLVLFAN